MFRRYIKIALIALSFSIITPLAHSAPNAVTLIVEGGSSSQSGAPITGSISLKYFAGSQSDVATIQTVLKRSSNSEAPTISGGRGTATPTASGTMVSLNLSPSISPMTAGTYILTVILSFINEASNIQTYDVSFTLTAPTPTPTPTPNAVTLTATNGSSSQSGSPISGSISLRYLATSISDVATIETILKSRPSTASSISISGGSGTVTPTSIGIVSLNLSPTISPTVAGTYTYTVVATFAGFPASTTTVDMSFTLTASTTVSPTPTPTPTPTQSSNQQTCTTPEDNTAFIKTILDTRNLLAQMLKSSPKYSVEISNLINKVDLELVEASKPVKPVCTSSTGNAAADALAAVSALASTIASLKTSITEMTNLVLKIQKDPNKVFGNNSSTTNNNDSNIGEDDGTTEDPYANLSITKSKNSKYLIKVASNLSEEDIVIKATKKGMSTIKYNKQTDTEGVISFYTTRNLNGYLVSLYFDGQKFDSFKVN